MRDFFRILIPIRALTLVPALTAVLATSCIEPIKLTPDIVGEIVAIEIEGQTRTPTINAAARTVNIEVGEKVDLTALRVNRIELVETASCDIKTGSVIDLSSPLRVAITTAASYEWTLTANNFFDAQRALPGGGFEEWNRTNILDEPDPAGKVWNPWPDGGVLGESRWWDTGNKGVATLGDSNSTATEPGEGCPANPSGRAARLETKYVVVKAAGGNIYFGSFGGLTPDLNATCDIGHPWQTKPKSLKGWYKYFPQPVDRVIDSYLPLHPFGLSKDQWMGSMDSLHVNIALWASPDGRNIPFTVNTSTGNNGANFVDFRRDTPGVIAYGSMVSGREQAEWAEFNLEMEYFNDGPLPANTQLFLQITPSKNCNYFIAGCSGGGPDGRTGSLMYVDELELVY